MSNPQNDPIYIGAEHRVHISAKEIRQQVKSDLFSKGVQTGYTTSYSWLADQFGHLGLGFIGLIILFGVIYGIGYVSGADTTYIVVRFGPALILIVTAVFAWKEINDYRSAAKDAAQAGTFPLRKMDVARDAATAVWFFLFGAVLAEGLIAIITGGTAKWEWVTLAAVMVIVSSAVAGFWLRRKMCFQRARLPVIFRLANFHAPELRRNGKDDTILKFTNLSGGERHLLITGPLQSGKTTIGCAIGTETTFRLSPARYFTLAAFGESFNAKKDPQSTTLNRLWSWKESNIIILDDISLDLLSKIDAETMADGTSWGKKFGDRRVVWLLADVGDVNTWKERLHGIFGFEPTVIRLPPPPDDGWPEKSANVVAKGFR